MRLVGDTISTFATPIARVFGADCIDTETRELREDSPCWKAKNRLNNGDPLLSVLYDRFFQQRTKGEKVKFIIQSEIEADDVIQALAKKNDATVLSINPRPVGAVPPHLVRQQEIAAQRQPQGAK